MRMLCRVALLSLFFFQLIHAQPEIAAKFKACLLTYPGGTLSYWLFTPEGYDPTHRYPLVLALHGSGCGDSVLVWGHMATFWANPISQAQHPSFVAVPICPVNMIWPFMSTAVGAMLDSLELAYSIDADRLYVTGLSLGGNGTWDLLTRFPGRFAAAAPVAGGWGVATVVDLFANTAIWDFHGALDTIVQVFESRRFITAMETQGRRVVFTNCLGNDQKSLPDSVIAMQVAAHADVFYTEVAGGNHDMELFEFVYDNHKFLLDWMFDKHRITPGVVTLTSPGSYQRLSGAVPITWTGGASTDSVQIWFSPDEGRTWRLIEGSVPNSGSYLWATGIFEDCGLGLVKIFLKDPDGHIYSSDQSPLFALDNVGNGPPSVSFLRNPRLISVYPNTWTDDTVTVAFHASDPEMSPLHVSMLCSADHGVTFTEIDSFTVASDSLPQNRLVHLGRGSNSQEAVLGVNVSDGLRSSMDVTRAFAKVTNRPLRANVVQTVGNGGNLKVGLVDSRLFTRNAYRVTFGATPDAKWYDVINLSRADTVVRHATGPFDGVTEGPLFDGMCLIVKDCLVPEADPDSTRWIHGTSPYGFSIGAPEIEIGGAILHGVRYPANYTITLYGTVVDMSDTAFGSSPKPMKFIVWNTTENRKTRVIYLDNDANGALSHLDDIIILEPDSLGKAQLAWELLMKRTNVRDPLPVAGDVFNFKTLKPIRNGDTFEFLGPLVESVASLETPLSFRLEQNYPNPFNPQTTIVFAVARSGPALLEVYNILGQRVRTLFSGFAVAAQEYRVVFSGMNLASGAYFYRLQAASYTDTKKLLLIR